MRALGIVLACLLSFSSHAVEITVLGVVLPGADYNKAVTFLNDVKNSAHWQNTSPVWPTIRIANYGLPVPMPAPHSDYSGTDFSQWSDAQADLANLNFRKDADLVIFFADQFTNFNPTVCGLAPQFHWIGLSFTGSPPYPRWQPNPASGLDLRGSEDSYTAIVATQGSCASETVTAVHEMGHLLGAGHTTPSDAGLLADSHGATFTPANLYPPTHLQTVMGNDPMGGANTGWFSRPGSYYYFYIPAGYNNAGTVATTAASVEAYRVAPTPPPLPPNMPPAPPNVPPGCGLQTPVGLTANIAGICVGSPPVSTACQRRP
jgi:hypothetical protein